MTIHITQDLSCLVCGSRAINQFLKRENVPVHQNLVMGTEVAAITINRGDIHLSVCEDCGYIFNNDFDWSKLIYGEDYDSTQTVSASFQNYENKLINYLAKEKGIQNMSVVEIGSGKGSFLRKLVEVEEWGNSGYGFDPSYEGPLREFDDRLKFEKCYYDVDVAQSSIKIDALFCRHVLEHLHEPLKLLHLIRQSLDRFPNVRIFFEVPCGSWILKNEVFWDVFYEHCSYFTPESLKTAFEASGFKVENVKQLFEWPYLWLEATIPDQVPAISKMPGDIPLLAQRFALSEKQQIAHWKKTIQELTIKGKVAFWGAAAKGVTFANAIDPEKQLIDCFIDLNPNKEGKFLPGTGHLIVNYQEAFNRGVRFALLMNPNYFEENQRLLRENAIEIELISPFNA